MPPSWAPARTSWRSLAGDGVTALRHAFAIAVLPFTMAVLVPLWLARRAGLTPVPATSAGGLTVQAAGLVLLAVGLTLFVASLRRFAIDGHGTLAPWDPRASSWCAVLIAMCAIR